MERNYSIISWKLTSIFILLVFGSVSSFFENISFLIGGIIGCLLMFYILKLIGQINEKEIIKELPFIIFLLLILLICFIYIGTSATPIEGVLILNTTCEGGLV